MSNNVHELVPTKPDTEVAAEFKKRIVKEHEPIIALWNEMAAAGFEVQMQISQGPLGYHIAALKIVKVY